MQSKSPGGALTKSSHITHFPSFGRALTKHDPGTPVLGAGAGVRRPALKPHARAGGIAILLSSNSVLIWLLTSGPRRQFSNRPSRLSRPLRRHHWREQHGRGSPQVSRAS